MPSTWAPTPWSGCGTMPPRWSARPARPKCSAMGPRSSSSPRRPERRGRGRLDRRPASRQERLDHAGRLDAGQALVEPLMAVGEPLVVEAEQVQHGGVEVADVDGVLDDVVRELVRLAV